MANIMQMFRAKNKPTRSGFDLSKKLAFTAKTGELLPIYSRLVMPGDKIPVGTKWITNTRPLNSDAYTTIREYYDWFFVPMNLLWDKYGTWFTAMKDNTQVATSINGGTQLTDKHPYFTTRQLQTALNSMDLSSNSKNAFGFKRSLQSKKLLSYLGYGDFYTSDDVLLPDGETMPREFDSNAQLSPWKILAYQKVCDDYFRFDQWTTSSPHKWNINYISGAAETLNIPTSEIDYTRLTMFDLNYANWNKDLFMGLLPNSQFGDDATIDLSSLDSVSNATDLSLYAKDATSAGSTYETISSGQQNTGYQYLLGYGSNKYLLNMDDTKVRRLKDALGLSTANLQSAFSILALRQAEALQKMKEIMGSNKKDFPSQIQARFGVSPSKAYSQMCTWLGGHDGTIDINPVVNSNLTGDAAATTRGRGTAGGSGRIDFETEVPGILMCIYHNQPRLDYATTGVDLQNLKTYFTDYAQPEFDRTGMQSVPMIALMNRFSRGWSSDNTRLLGYAPIYIDYKTDIDEIKGGFVYGGLNSWVAPVGNRYIDNWLTQNGTYELIPHWDGLDQWFFKINPSVLDPIFAGENADSYLKTDQFWINVYFDIKAVRPLDADGLPY